MTLKKVNPKQLLYHYFERSVSEFALYDDELDMPIAYGSRNLVDSAVRNLRKSVTIVYYRRDTDKTAFKKKLIYKGKEEMEKILNKQTDITTLP
jgi:hypothetical protein